jgi:hypothetical protein
MAHKSTAKPYKYLNIIMHGVFGYSWLPAKGILHALTPSVCDHIYCARNYGATFPEAGRKAHSELLFGDYTLTGVAKSTTFTPDGTTPLLPAKMSKIDRCDYYGKRFFSIELPYPTGDELARSKPYYLLEPYHVGSIYAGAASKYLNAFGESFPSLFCFVYKLDPAEPLALVPTPHQPALRANQKPPQPIALDFLLPRGKYANLHIIGGLEPEGSMDMSKPSLTSSAPSKPSVNVCTDPATVMPDHAPHARRAFASLVDMFDSLPLTLQIPDFFTPQKIGYELPTGLSCNDVELPEDHVHFGRANCHNATFVIDNRKTAVRANSANNRGST